MSTATDERYTLLLVDDEPHILNALKRLFRRERLELLIANSGAEALRIIKAQTVQVLLTDNRMPEMTGLELVKHVKDVSPETIRIILSGQSDLDAVLAAVNEGEVFRFLLKPWNDLDLKLTVSLAMAHYNLELNNRTLNHQLREASQVLDLLKERYPDIAEALVKEVRDSEQAGIAEQNVNNSQIAQV